MKTHLLLRNGRKSAVLTFLLVLFATGTFAQSTGTTYTPADAEMQTGTAYGVSGGTESIVNTTSRTGTQSVKFNPGSTTAKYWYNNNIGVLPGVATGYAHVIFWAKAEIGSGTPTMTATPNIRYNTAATTGNGSSSSTTGSTVALNTSTWNRVAGNTTVTSSTRYYYAAPMEQTTVNNVGNNFYVDDLVMYYTSTNDADDIAKPNSPSGLNTAGTNVSWTNGSDVGSGTSGTQASGLKGTLILTSTNAAAAAPILLDQGYYPVSSAFNSDWTVAANLAVATTNYTVTGTPAQVAVVHFDLAYNYSVAVTAAINVSSPFITVNQTGYTGLFGNVVAPGNSAEQTYTVSGANLTGDIVVTAPTDFQVSTTTGSGFGTTATLYQLGGSVTATTIYVRYAPATATGASGSLNIANASAGATTINVGVGGSALATEPSGIGTISFNTVTSSTIDINLPTIGNGGNRIIVVKQGSAPGAPTDGTAYTANTALGLGSTTSAGSYVLYNGNGQGSSLLTVTGLTAGLTYYFAVYEYNVGSGLSQNYFTTSSAGGVQATPAPTYDWTGATSNVWTVASNWYPSRTTPSVTDILQFGSGTLVTVTGVTTQTIATLSISNNTSLTMQGTSGQTLSISSGLNVGAGSSLVQSTTLNTTITSGAQATISGNLEVAAGTFTTTGTTSVDGSTAYMKQSGGAISGASAATLLFKNGGTFELAINGTIPTASWTGNGASTCLVTGINSTTAPTGRGQTFYNFTWDCASQPAGKMNFNQNPQLNVASGGSMWVMNTGLGQIQLCGSGTNQTVFNLSGSYKQSGGLVSIWSASSGNRSMSIGGGTDLSGGSLIISESVGTGSGTLNVLGNLSLSGTGNISQSSTIADLKLSGTSAQTITGLTGTGLVGGIHITINNSAGIILGSNLDIIDTLTLTNGVINNPGNYTIAVSNSDPASINGGGLASGTSFIDGGAITRLQGTTGTYEYPVGSGSNYRAVRLTPGGTTGTNQFTVHYIPGIYSDTTSTDHAYRTSAIEYWNISHTSGSDAMDVALITSNTTASNIQNNATVKVGHYNGTSWDTVASTGNAYNGTGSIVTASGVSSFSPFTFMTPTGTGSVLPIKLTDIQARNEGTSNVIGWVTAMETEGVIYELQRSKDAVLFITIGTVFGKGAASNYVYDDNQPLSGTNYYRLRIREISGHIEYSKTVSVAVGRTDLSVIAAVNPVHDQLVLQIAGSNGEKTEISLINATGRLIQTLVTDDATVIFYTHCLAAGTYLVKYSNHANTGAIKVVIQ